MSNISNIHTAQVHEPKVSKAFEGQRLVVTTAKGTKNAAGKMVYGEHLQQTMSTSIPVLTAAQVDWTSTRVQTHMIAYLHTVQNELMLEALKSGVKSWTTEELEIDALCKYLETTSQGERWDAERVALWFVDSLAPHIYAYYETQGKSEEFITDKIEKLCKGFSETLGSRAAIPMARAKMLLDVLALMPQREIESSPIALRFYARLDKILNPKIDEDLFGL